MHYDGLIFDLDGTLWNCTKACADGFNLAYKKFGLNKQVTKEFVASISGKPSSECDQILLSDVPTELHKELSRYFDKFEIEAIKQYAPTALYSDVNTDINTLKLYYKLFVVSNCSEHYLEVFHKHTSIGYCFTDSECYGRTRKLKHENIRQVIERNKLLSACYIGDTAGDESAANQAGIPFFHASYGFGKPVGSVTCFESFKVLSSYFLNLS